MVLNLKTFAPKGCKIAAAKKVDRFFVSRMRDFFFFFGGGGIVYLFDIMFGMVARQG